jgi:hypothetical protein
MAKKNLTDYSSVFKEFERRVRNIVGLQDKLVTLTRYFCAILSTCDNLYNQHFAENALTLFTFIAFEIEALTFGYLPFESQERFYKGFISKQSGSFDKEVLRGNKRDMTMRLTSCCVEYLTLKEVISNNSLCKSDMF